MPMRPNRMLYGDVEELVLGIGRNRDRAVRIAGIVAAIDIFAAHASLLSRPRLASLFLSVSPLHSGRAGFDGPVPHRTASSLYHLLRLHPQPRQLGGLDPPARIRPNVGLMIMAESVQEGAAIRQRMFLGAIEPVLHCPH